MRIMYSANLSWKVFQNVLAILSHRTDIREREPAGRDRDVRGTR
jgi:predicted transcriptional regulator